jgi:hypothetical protein
VRIFSRKKSSESISQTTYNRDHLKIQEKIQTPFSVGLLRFDDILSLSVPGRAGTRKKLNYFASMNFEIVCWGIIRKHCLNLYCVMVSTCLQQTNRPNVYMYVHDSGFYRDRYISSFFLRLFPKFYHSSLCCVPTREIVKIVASYSFSRNRDSI